MTTETQNPELTSYDRIVISSSGGKDSQAMLTMMVEAADFYGIDRSRLLVVHADLGRVEWEGTRELAEAQAAHYGLRFEVVSRKQDLLGQVEQRGKWPSSSARYCTSDHKRDQIAKLYTRLAKEVTAETGKPARILECWGIRAEESSARAKKVAFQNNKRASNGRRTVDTWMPIHQWNEAEVWGTIERSGVPHHRAYDLGMPRLSCCFCVLASRNSLLIAGENNPELLDTYVEVEARIGHSFMHNKPISEIREALAAGERGVPHDAPVPMMATCSG